MGYIFIGVGVVSGLVSVVNAVLARRSARLSHRTVVEVRQPDGNAVTVSTDAHVDVIDLLGALHQPDIRPAGQ